MDIICFPFAKTDHVLMADAMRDLVIGELSESEFADILYHQYLSGIG